MQPQVNLLYREEERETIPLCQDMGVAVIPWSPLAGGRLVRPLNEKTPRTDANRSGAIAKDYEEYDKQVIKAVAHIAEAHHVSAAEVAHVWLLQKPGISFPMTNELELTVRDCE